MPLTVGLLPGGIGGQSGNGAAQRLIFDESVLLRSKLLILDWIHRCTEKSLRPTILINGYHNRDV